MVPADYPHLILHELSGPGLLLRSPAVGAYVGFSIWVATLVGEECHVQILVLLFLICVPTATKADTT